MGMSSKKVKTTSTTKPVFADEIGAAAKAQGAAYAAALPGINKVSGNLLGLSDKLLGEFDAGDPAITAAKGYITDTLGANPQNNPYLDQMVTLARDNTRNDLQAKMGTRGLTGGSAYYDMMGRGLAEAELGLRYSDFDKMMQRKAQAAGMAPGVVAGEYLPVAAAMQAGSQGAMLPLQAATGNSAATAGLLGQYTNSTGTQKQSGGFLSDLLLSGISAVGAAASGGAFSDRACKTNVERVGTTPGGLPVYDFDYIWGGPRQRGVMAQEVAKVQPWALGPVVDGLMTVNYAEIR